MMISTFETIDHRVLGAIRLVDITTGLPIRAPLRVEGAGLDLRRNRRGDFVIWRAAGLETHSQAFNAPPAAPPVGALTFDLSITDPAGNYLPRRSALALPRSADPDAPNSFFTPAPIALFPAGRAHGEQLGGDSRHRAPVRDARATALGVDQGAARHQGHDPGLWSGGCPRGGVGGCPRHPHHNAGRRWRAGAYHRVGGQAHGELRWRGAPQALRRGPGSRRCKTPTSTLCRTRMPWARWPATRPRSRPAENRPFRPPANWPPGGPLSQIVLVTLS